MLYLQRTDSNNQYFIDLVEELDTYLAIVDGEEHAFYDQYNSIDNLSYVVVAYLNNKAVGCGAIKTYDSNTMEVKRMFIKPEVRNKGIASLILLELEQWAIELGSTRCILETGNRQKDAIALYTKNGYYTITNYGQYIGVENSVCFEKIISK